MTKSIIALLFLSTLILSGMTKKPCPPCRNQQVSTIYALAGGKDIGTYDLTTGVFTLLSTVTTVTFSRIAVSADNQLYGIDGSGLYSISPTAGTATLIGPTTRVLLSFAFGPNGALYGVDVDNNFCEINLITGAASPLFAINGFTYLANGMTYDPISELFYISSDDGNGFASYLVTVTLDNTVTISEGFGTYTLFNGVVLDGETLYGISYEGYQVIFDKTTGDFTLDKTVTGTTSKINTVTRASDCANPSRRVLLARKRRLL